MRDHFHFFLKFAFWGPVRATGRARHLPAAAPTPCCRCLANESIETTRGEASPAMHCSVPRALLDLRESPDACDTSSPAGNYRV